MINKRKVLIISSGEKLLPVLKEMMPMSEYSCFISKTVHDAKIKLRSESFDFVIIQTPVKDEFGIKSSQEISHIYDVSVILLVKNDIFDTVVYRLKEESIFVVSLPTSKQVLYQTLCLMNTFVSQKEKAQMEIKKLRKKLKDQQIISQAKLVLIEQYHWSEEKAHHYIEKVAMDASITKIEVATRLLEKVK
ncbi:ANTAR domain-containing response regulator [Floccifex sp.]|uniref:ANTAR domain-containing response regulator n=1 Tax=Floccifex sp. TaxID=2815810 RepID=UPI003EFF4D5E